ncbi:MAG TPA: ROK family transcriptional regulator [Pyrinomonadaceae bacterium]|nr:ROK family transcriptional regulator [Pyrinomonadaceae bacterium]
MRRLDLRKTQAARLNTIRDINRQIVLNYVREREPISRAEIARETDLQRSTISAIVEALTAEGLVEEVGEGESTGGRRPTLLRLRTKEAIAIGVAITPTCTTVATSDLAGRIVEQREFLTNPDPDQTLGEVMSLIRELSASNKGSIEAVGVSLPGLVDPSTGNAVYVPYFKWRDLPIAKTISAAVSLPVIIDNDANAAALAELWFGRPEVSDARDFILVLVAEGVGTGIIFDGQVYRGQRGAAGEFGHMVIGTQAPVPCSCGNRDCWEAFSSERAAVARYLESSPDLQMPGEASRSSFGFQELVDRALHGEANAKAALIETAHYLGVGISNLVVGFSPEVVVVGGEIVRAWSLVENALTETIEHSVRRGLASAKILPSTLGESPALRGALSLVLASKFAAAFAA